MASKSPSSPNVALRHAVERRRDGRIRCFTDGSFDKELEPVAFLLDHEVKNISGAPVVLAGTGQNWMNEPIITVRIQNDERVVASSAFPLELLAIVVGLRIAKKEEEENICLFYMTCPGASLTTGVSLEKQFVKKLWWGLWWRWFGRGGGRATKFSIGVRVRLLIFATLASLNFVFFVCFLCVSSLALLRSAARRSPTPCSGSSLVCRCLMSCLAP